MGIKNVSEWNENFRVWNNFNVDGDTWIVLGDTYEIKDELKKKGAKFNRELGWHFDHDEPGYQTYKVNMNDVAYARHDGRLHMLDNVYDIVSKIKEENTIYEPSNSQFVGEVGKKIEFDAVLKDYRSFYSSFGETGIFEFEDFDGNCIVWMTSAGRDIDYDHIYWIEGFVKSHSEYKGKKQTRVSRCKIKGVSEK